MSEFKGKYMIALAVIAGFALFFVGVYAMEFKDKGTDETNEFTDVTLTIQDDLIVTVGDIQLKSGIKFQTKGDVELNITLPETGEYRVVYTDPGTGGSGDQGEFGHKGAILTATIFVSPGFSSNITGSITFEAGS